MFVRSKINQGKINRCRCSMEEAGPNKDIFAKLRLQDLYCGRGFFCQSVKTSVLADGDLWEVVVCAGHRRSRWLWENLRHNILKQIHKYSGCGKDCLWIFLSRQMWCGGVLSSRSTLAYSLLDIRHHDASVCGAVSQSKDILGADFWHSYLVSTGK